MREIKHKDTKSGGNHVKHCETPKRQMTMGHIVIPNTIRPCVTNNSRSQCLPWDPPNLRRTSVALSPQYVLMSWWQFHAISMFRATVVGSMFNIREVKDKTQRQTVWTNILKLINSTKYCNPSTSRPAPRKSNMSSSQIRGYHYWIPCFSSFASWHHLNSLVQIVHDLQCPKKI